MNDERGGRASDSSFILHPSSFILCPSSLSFTLSRLAGHLATCRLRPAACFVRRLALRLRLDRRLRRLWLAVAEACAQRIHQVDDLRPRLLGYGVGDLFAGVDLFLDQRADA